jgi:hypothetical protein
MAEEKQQLNYQTHFESQKQRWIKYGANVILSSVVVIVLAIVITYLAQRSNRRLDTTANRAYSLKPQTLNILKDLKGDTKIVSLYSKTTAGSEAGAEKTDYAQPVADLLDEYQRHSSKVTVESIDPVASPSKVDDLINEVTNKYGGEVAQYKKVTDAYTGTYDQIKKLAAAEVQKVSALPVDQISDEDATQTVKLAILTVREFPKLLNQSKEKIDARLKQKPPDYKAATSSIEQNMDLFSQMTGRILEEFARAKDDKKLPEPVRKYMADAAPSYTQIKKLADDLLKQVKSLGELKLDELRQSLRARDAILVMGQNDMRVIPFENVWKADDRDLRGYAQGQELKPRFAGEQQISTAILALNEPKKKVCIVRSGGPPLATPGMPPFQRGGPLAEIASRLRDYNYEVLEKDLSGMYAMQAQMQQQPAPPEPTDEQIKDAIWIVLAFPMTQQNPMMPPPNITPKVEEHLKQGGSAMIIFAPRSDKMESVLKPLGIDVHPDAVAVHQPIKATEGRQADMIEDAQRYPFVFDIRDYGDHMITRPLKSLESWLVPLLAVKTSSVSGVKTTPILPIPQNPPSWGETDMEALQDPGKFDSIKFDEGKDVASPVYGGAVAEKDGGGRVVVITSPTFAFDQYINEPDPNMLRRGLVVSRFPGNAELFLNSVYWLSKMEPMIAISPAAMEVSRIEPISEPALKAWRIGGLLIGLPGLVVLAGVMVYFARRD